MNEPSITQSAWVLPKEDVCVLSVLHVCFPTLGESNDQRKDDMAMNMTMKNETQISYEYKFCSVFEQH